MSDDRTELQRLISGELTPDIIRRGANRDWRFFGDYDPNLYAPKPQAECVDEWEAKVSYILGKNGRGMWIVNGPRGSGKSLAAVTCAFYYKQIYDRPVASNFPLKPPFGEYRPYALDDIRDQLERLRALPDSAGTADWKSATVDSFSDRLCSEGLASS